MKTIQVTGWTHSSSMQKGDIFTIEGVYYRRTFWQWLTRKPRRSTLFEIIE